ncbi:MAG: hypothetical protein KF693_05175 [Nitrospira sp.]|nr:hypothetical protein [Nitrospira sp.]
MPPKTFQKIDLAQPATTNQRDKAPTTKTDNSKPFATCGESSSALAQESSGEKTSFNYGEQNEYNATVPYPGTRRLVNVTVNAPELQEGIRKQKEAFARTIQANQEYRRVPKGQRALKHKLPLQEEYLEDGDIKVTRPSTVTTRKEH